MTLFTWACACYVGPPVLIESLLPLAHLFMGSTLRLVDVKAQPPTQCASCFAGADHMEWNLLQQYLMPLRSPCRNAAGLAYWILLYCCLKLATMCIGSGPLWRDSDVDLCETLPVTGTGQPVWSYWWITVCGSLCWAWVCAERTKLHTKSGFYPYHAQGQVAKISSHPEICVYLQAAC